MSEFLQLMAATRGSIQPPNCSFLPCSPDNAEKGRGESRKAGKDIGIKIKTNKTAETEKRRGPSTPAR